MDFALTAGQRELRDRAARSVNAELIPLEEQAELAGGRLPPAAVAQVKRAARDAGLVGGNHAQKYGGQGWTAFEQVLVQEELGRNTNGVWWNMGGGYDVLARGTGEQIRRYLEPTLRGERQTPMPSPGRRPPTRPASPRRPSAPLRAGGSGPRSGS